MSLTKKIDFALIIKVTNANPNGDPLNGNRPRADFAGFGEMTDVCLKRKIRDRLQDGFQLLDESGKAHGEIIKENIFVQSDEKKTDGMTSLANRAKDKEVGLGADAFGKKANKDETAKQACEKWLDVRSFGQVFAFGKSDEGAGVSIAVRGPVTIQSAFSVEPVNITSTQITKSVSGEGDGSKRGSDTMGMKHRVDSGIYVAFGAMSPQLAERTGFSDDDADKIKAVLTKLFEGDASSARPEGSMQVLKLIWWEHNCKAGQYSSAKVHDQLRKLIEENRENLTAEKLHGLITEEVLSLSKENGVLKPEIIDGF